MDIPQERVEGYPGGNRMLEKQQEPVVRGRVVALFYEDSDFSCVEFKPAQRDGIKQQW